MKRPRAVRSEISEALAAPSIRFVLLAMLIGTVYLLHCDRPFWGPMQHYMGFTRNLPQRLDVLRMADEEQGAQVRHLAKWQPAHPPVRIPAMAGIPGRGRLMDDSTTYDVRVYRSELYKGARVTPTESAGRWGPAVGRRLPQWRSSRQLPQFPADRGSQGRGVQP